MEDTDMGQSARSMERTRDLDIARKHGGTRTMDIAKRHGGQGMVTALGAWRNDLDTLGRWRTRNMDRARSMEDTRDKDIGHIARSMRPREWTAASMEEQGPGHSARSMEEHGDKEQDSARAWREDKDMDSARSMEDKDMDQRSEHGGQGHGQR
eukprot:gene3796-13865_t